MRGGPESGFVPEEVISEEADKDAESNNGKSELSPAVSPVETEADKARQRARFLELLSETKVEHKQGDGSKEAVEALMDELEKDFGPDDYPGEIRVARIGNRAEEDEYARKLDDIEFATTDYIFEFGDGSRFIAGQDYGD